VKRFGLLVLAAALSTAGCSGSSDAAQAPEKSPSGESSQNASSPAATTPTTTSVMTGTIDVTDDQSAPFTVTLNVQAFPQMGQNSDGLPPGTFGINSPGPSLIAVATVTSQQTDRTAVSPIGGGGTIYGLWPPAACAATGGTNVPLTVTFRGNSYCRWTLGNWQGGDENYAARGAMSFDIENNFAPIQGTQAQIDQVFSALSAAPAIVEFDLGSAIRTSPCGGINADGNAELLSATAMFSMPSGNDLCSG
jgi:hypothetical protein